MLEHFEVKKMIARNINLYFKSLELKKYFTNTKSFTWNLLRFFYNSDNKFHIPSLNFEVLINLNRFLSLF